MIELLQNSFVIKRGDDQMKYENIKKYKNGLFYRITGVRRNTFDKMIEILEPEKTQLTSKGGPKPKISLEDMLLATLEYLRENRTYAHVAASYGVSESTICRIIEWVSETLINEGTFSLPGRKIRIKEETVNY